MDYLVTGATGFIGRHLLAQLLKRGATVHALVRPASRGKLQGIIRDLGADGARVVALEGDLTAPLLGVAPQVRDALRGRIAHFYHLGAIYDLVDRDAPFEQSNVEGTRHAVDLAEDLRAGCFHLVSSIASAGNYRGTFTEQMFEEATGLEHPYFRTKHDSEALVRSGCCIPWRVYRPGMVVGHSATGVMDKIDGPYYLFKAIQKIRDHVPRWMPLVGVEGGYINLVPVDFVAAALAHLSHVPGQDGRCFHLTDPHDRRVGEVLNLIASAAHAPTMTLRLEPALLAAIPAITGTVGEALSPLRRIGDAILRDLGVPRAILDLIDHPTRFDASSAQALLAEAGIQLPRLEDYVWRLWDYWERVLDPELRRDLTLRGAVAGRKVLITGGSSGIGRATALKVAAAGAHVLLVARDADKLARTEREIAAAGGNVSIYSCDIGEPADCDRFIARVLEEHGHVDVLINNAGHSIRRAVENTYERQHDYERLMKINYFAAVRVTLGFLPAMVSRGSGHVIGISSIGVLSNAPRFAGYNASKAALEAFTRCAGAEYCDRGVHFTIVNMPLVRTPMVAPTKMYDDFALWTPERAADLVCDAIVHRPQRLATRLGQFARIVDLVAPGIGELIMNEGFRMYPESEAEGAPAGTERHASREQRAFASLMHGIHW